MFSDGRRVERLEALAERGTLDAFLVMEHPLRAELLESLELRIRPVAKGIFVV